MIVVVVVVVVDGGGTTVVVVGRTYILPSALRKEAWAAASPGAALAACSSDLRCFSKKNLMNPRRVGARDSEARTGVAAWTSWRGGGAGA